MATSGVLAAVKKNAADTTVPATTSIYASFFFAYKISLEGGFSHF